LNPTLYALLKKRFGEVKIGNPGAGMAVAEVHDRLRGVTRRRVTSKGEYYAVCCPYCNDTRFRLNIGHCWGRQDPETGWRWMSLAVCWNDTRCLDNPRLRDDLLEDITELDGQLDRAPVRKADPAPERPDVIDWPGDVVRLNELDPDHPARRYMEKDRGFDVDILSRVYHVSWCVESKNYHARERIIIPVYQWGKLRHWQARYPGELPWHDKALKRSLPLKYGGPTGGNPSHLLYNLDQASRYETVIICEGVTDVWRVGPMAVSVFGNSVKRLQQKALVTAFGERSVILLLDPDKAGDAGARSAEDLAAEFPQNRFCRVRLPEGRDPASFDRPTLRRLVTELAAAQGVDVSYSKAVTAK
jgi:hypothetical protein